MQKETLLSPIEIAYFFQQISMIIKAGIPVGEGLSIMAEDIHNPSKKELTRQIKKYMDNGQSFYFTLAITKKFPKYVVDMVEIGEKSGRLDQVSDSLCSYYEREDKISQSIKSAIAYPLLMIIMMLIVIGVLAVKVLPIFAQVYTQLGSTSLKVENIITISNISLIIMTVIIGIIALGGITAFFMNKTTKGRESLNKFKSQFFLTKNIQTSIARGRFASAMDIAMSSGLDIDQALSMSSRLVNNHIFVKKIQSCQSLISQGWSFSSALVKSEIFTGMQAQMVVVAFKTGSVDMVMAKLADGYDEDVNYKISRLIGLLEPTLVAALSIIVGAMLLAVMLPLMGIMSTIG